MERIRGRVKSVLLAFAVVLVLCLWVRGCVSPGNSFRVEADREVVRETEKMLREKYGGAFTVQKIFGRFGVRIPGGTEEWEETEMLVHPSDDETLLFEAKFLASDGDDKKKLYDEYPAAWAGKIYEKRICEAAGDVLGEDKNWLVHVEAGSKSFPDDCFYLNNGRITPEEFTRRKPGSAWAIWVAVSGKETEAEKERRSFFQSVAGHIRGVSEGMRGSIYFYVLGKQKLEKAGAYLKKNAKVDYGFDRIAGSPAAEIRLKRKQEGG
uniref:hypothetical protein n=1 Tax=Eubacterium cellulosolvens TaxID=29322 RepID=UPI000488E66F|nr:hypothetical protein [[Eubacterium] cellulosolvens]